MKMLVRLLPTVCLLSLAVTLASAQIKPTTPGPNETYKAGSPCKIAWTPDESGSWTNMTIDLMSGANSNMSIVTTVVNGFDGTNASLTPFSWTCPEVTPHSAIYFYQFTNGNQTLNSTWTTRFTIASRSGQIEQPAFMTQPNGDQVPWGLGQLKEEQVSEEPSSLVESAKTANSAIAQSATSEIADISLETPALPITSKPRKHGKHISTEGSENGEDSESDEHTRYHRTKSDAKVVSETSGASSARKSTPSSESGSLDQAQASPSADCHCYNEQSASGALRLSLGKHDLFLSLVAVLAIVLVISLIQF